MRRACGIISSPRDVRRDHGAAGEGISAVNTANCAAGQIFLIVFIVFNCSNHNSTVIPPMHFCYCEMILGRHQVLSSVFIQYRNVQNGINSRGCLMSRYTGRGAQRRIQSQFGFVSIAALLCLSSAKLERNRHKKRQPAAAAGRGAAADGAGRSRQARRRPRKRSSRRRPRKRRSGRRPPAATPVAAPSTATNYQVGEAAPAGSTAPLLNTPQTVTVDAAADHPRAGVQHGDGCAAQRARASPSAPAKAAPRATCPTSADSMRATTSSATASAIRAGTRATASPSTASRC